MSYLIAAVLLFSAALLWKFLVLDVYVRDILEMISRINSCRQKVDEKRAAVLEIELRVRACETSRNAAMRAYMETQSETNARNWDGEEGLLGCLVTTLNDRRKEVEAAVADFDAANDRLRQGRSGWRGALLRRRR